MNISLIDKVFFKKKILFFARSHFFFFSFSFLPFLKLGSSKPTIRIGASEISDGNTHGYLLKMSKSLNDKSLSFHKWKSRYFVLKVFLFLFLFLFSHQINIFFPFFLRIIVCIILKVLLMKKH